MTDNHEITSLDTAEFKPETHIDFELSSFEQSELDIIDSFYNQKFDTIDKLRKRFKRVSGVMLDTTMNTHGFSLSSAGLQTIEEHFNQTKTDPILHRKFLNHKFQDIEKQVGKLTKIWYDAKDNVLRYKGVDDKKHPATERSDAFNSVSATIAHGDRSCSVCSKSWRSLRQADCDCQGSHPVSNRAMNIELSYVSFPAYRAANSQVDEFGGGIELGVVSFFADLGQSLDEGISDKDKIAAESKAKELAEKEAARRLEKAKAKILLSEEKLKEIIDLTNEVKDLRNAIK